MAKSKEQSKSNGEKWAWNIFVGLGALVLLAAGIEAIDGN
jgi:hypothetical protein